MYKNSFSKERNCWLILNNIENADISLEDYSKNKVFYDQINDLKKKIEI